MSKEKLIKATHEGIVEIGTKELNCAVLEDGTRILSQSAVYKALDRAVRSKSNVGNRVDQMPSFLDANNLQPFVNQVLRDMINEIIYIGVNGKKHKGYNARILPKVAKVYLDARRQGALTKKQLPVADSSEILISALAEVAITALVDEATGYQYDREKDELQKILKAYIAEELLPWQKRFPDIFYQELFRLNGWNFTVRGIKKRPGVVGRWTNKLIYNELPKGVLEELKKKTPRSKKGNRTARFFQSLTEDIGHPHLADQIKEIITLFRLSDNMKHMWSQFEKLKQRQGGQLELDFKFDEKGHTIEPTEESNLSSHNKNLMTALKFNPKEK